MTADSPLRVERRLVALAHGGERGAFATLLHRTLEHVRRQLVADGVEGKDLTEHLTAVYAEAAASLADLHVGDPVRPWLLELAERVRPPAIRRRPRRRRDRLVWASVPTTDLADDVWQRLTADWDAATTAPRTGDARRAVVALVTAVAVAALAPAAVLAMSDRDGTDTDAITAVPVDQPLPSPSTPGASPVAASPPALRFQTVPGADSAAG